MRSLRRPYNFLCELFRFLTMILRVNMNDIYPMKKRTFDHHMCDTISAQVLNKYWVTTQSFLWVFVSCISLYLQLINFLGLHVVVK